MRVLMKDGLNAMRKDKKFVRFIKLIRRLRKLRMSAATR